METGNSLTLFQLVDLVGAELGSAAVGSRLALLIRKNYLTEEPSPNRRHPPADAEVPSQKRRDLSLPRREGVQIKRYPTFPF